MAARASTVANSAIVDYNTSDERMMVYSFIILKLKSIPNKCSIIENLVQYYKDFFIKHVASYNSIHNDRIYEENLSIILSKFVLDHISPHFYLYYDSITCNVHNNKKIKIMTYILYEKCQQTFNTYFGIMSESPRGMISQNMLAKILTKENDYKSFLIQMIMADITLNAYGITIGDRQGKNFMYLSIPSDCYLYYLLDNKHIYVKTYGKLWVHIDYEVDGTNISRKTTVPVFDISIFSKFTNNDTQFYLIDENPRRDIKLFNTNPFKLFNEEINSNKLHKQYFANKPHTINSHVLQHNPILTKSDPISLSMPSFSMSHLPPIILKESDNVYKSTELSLQYLMRAFPKQPVDRLLDIIQQLWQKAGNIVIPTSVKDMINTWNYKFVKTIVSKNDYTFDFFVIKEQDTYHVVYSSSYGEPPALKHFKKILQTLQIAGRYKKKTRKHKKVKRNSRTYRL